MSLKKNVRVISLFCHMWYFLSLLGKKYWMVLFYYLKYKFWLIQLCTCSFYQFFVLFSLKFLVHYRSALLVQSIFLDLGGFSSKSKPSFSGIRQVRFATRYRVKVKVTRFGKNWTKWVRSSVEVLVFASSLSEVECRGLKNSVKLGLFEESSSGTSSEVEFLTLF